MMNIEFTKYNILFGASVFFALWVLFTSSIWSDFSNITISYPFGLIGLYLSIAGNIFDPQKSRYTIPQCILTLGVIWPMIVLMFK